MARASDIQSRIAAALLRLLASRSWAEITLAQIARSAKLSLADLLAVAPSKPAVAGMLLRAFGRETLARYRPDRSSRSARERLFDVAMTWFDVQQPHKKPLHHLYGGLARDPLTLFFARKDLVEICEWLLALAEADAGRSSPLKAVALAGVLARAVPVWLEDDAEMGNTMARLDRDLARVEQIVWRSARSDSGKRQARPK